MTPTEETAEPAESVRLEPFRPVHFATLAAWFTDQAELTRWGGARVRFPLDRAQLTAMLPAPPAREAWMAVLGGALVGHAQLTSVDPAAGVARLGRIAVAPAWRGRGLAVSMLGAVLERAFAIEGIARVDLGVYTGNAVAIGLYRRLGFDAGPVRVASVRVGDRAWDLQEMSLCRDAWAGSGEGSVRRSGGRGSAAPGRRPS